MVDAQRFISTESLLAYLIELQSESRRGSANFAKLWIVFTMVSEAMQPHHHVLPSARFRARKYSLKERFNLGLRFDKRALI